MQASRKRQPCDGDPDEDGGQDKPKRQRGKGKPKSKPVPQPAQPAQGLEVPVADAAPKRKARTDLGNLKEVFDAKELQTCVLMFFNSFIKSKQRGSLKKT